MTPMSRPGCSPPRIAADGALARFRSRDAALEARRARRAARPADAAGRARHGEQRARHDQPGRRSGARSSASTVDALIYVDAVQSVPHVADRRRRARLRLPRLLALQILRPAPGRALGARARALDAYKVRPAGDDGAHRFETGTPSFEGQAGVLGTIDYLEWLGSEADPARQ